MKFSTASCYFLFLGSDVFHSTNFSIDYIAYIPVYMYACIYTQVSIYTCTHVYILTCVYPIIRADKLKKTRKPSPTVSCQYVVIMCESRDYVLRNPAIRKQICLNAKTLLQLSHQVSLDAFLRGIEVLKLH